MLNNLYIKTKMASVRSYASVLASAIERINPVPIGQLVPLAGHEEIMSKNNAGGFTYEVDWKDELLRGLILGTFQNTYYTNAEVSTADFITKIKKLVEDNHGDEAIDLVKNVYDTGRAPKQEPVILTLAILCQTNIPNTIRSKAGQLVSSFRIPPHLYTWVNMCTQIAGKKMNGRFMRTVLFNWFKKYTGSQLAYIVTKYQQRDCGGKSWSIQDLVRLYHVPSKKLPFGTQLVISYIAHGIGTTEQKFKESPAENKTGDPFVTIEYLRAVANVKSSECNKDEVISLIRAHRLSRESLESSHLVHTDVWHALLYKPVPDSMDLVITMPITALIKNLGGLSSRKLFENDTIVKIVTSHLVNHKALSGGRVHPVLPLIASFQYKNGKGDRGKLSWDVHPEIHSALEESFYMAFGTIEGTGLPILHAADVSGSMSSAQCAVPQLRAHQATGVLIMEAIRREHKHYMQKLMEYEEIKTDGIVRPEYIQDVMKFGTDGTYINITPYMKFQEVLDILNTGEMGTDCAQPMIHALKLFRSSDGTKGRYKLFIIYTDNETWYGGIHPSEALDNYNTETGMNARMVVVAMTPTTHTIGYSGKGRNLLDSTDPRNNSPLALNVVGFDTSTPDIIRNFASLNTNIGQVDKTVDDD